MLKISNTLFACYPIFVVAAKLPFIRQSAGEVMWGASPMPRGCTDGPHNVRQGSVLLAGPAEPYEPLWQLLGAAGIPASPDGHGRCGVGALLFAMGCQPRL